MPTPPADRSQQSEADAGEPQSRTGAPADTIRNPAARCAAGGSFAGTRPGARSRPGAKRATDNATRGPGDTLGADRLNPWRRALMDLALANPLAVVNLMQQKEAEFPAVLQWPLLIAITSGREAVGMKEPT
jgi:hypothetical protein